MPVTLQMPREVQVKDILYAISPNAKASGCQGDCLVVASGLYAAANFKITADEFTQLTVAAAREASSILCFVSANDYKGRKFIINSQYISEFEITKNSLLIKFGDAKTFEVFAFEKTPGGDCLGFESAYSGAYKAQSTRKSGETAQELLATVINTVKDPAARERLMNLPVVRDTAEVTAAEFMQGVPPVVKSYRHGTLMHVRGLGVVPVENVMPKGVIRFQHGVPQL